MDKYFRQGLFFIFAPAAIALTLFNLAIASDDDQELEDRCKKNTSEEIIASKTFVGKLDHFEWGDYLHSEVRDSRGNIESFFSGHSDSCFMALHKGEQLVIEYDVMCQYFQYGAGYYPSQVITQIKSKNADLKSWEQSFDFSKNDEACDKEIEKYTVKQ